MCIFLSCRDLEFGSPGFIMGSLFQEILGVSESCSLLLKCPCQRWPPFSTSTHGPNRFFRSGYHKHIPASMEVEETKKREKGNLIVFSITIFQSLTFSVFAYISLTNIWAYGHILLQESEGKTRQYVIMYPSKDRESRLSLSWLCHC